MREREAGVRRGLDPRRGKRKKGTDPSREREEEGLSLKRERIAQGLEKGKSGPGPETEIIGPGPGTGWSRLVKAEEADRGHPKRRYFILNLLPAKGRGKGKVSFHSSRLYLRYL